jgi:hypothetical protein
MSSYSFDTKLTFLSASVGAHAPNPKGSFKQALGWPSAHVPHHHVSFNNTAVTALNSLLQGAAGLNMLLHDPMKYALRKPRVPEAACSFVIRADPYSML